MTTPPITDHEVARLPVHGGRAELLEEIVRMPVDLVEGVNVAVLPRRQRRGLVSVAAAAAVAATVAGVAAWQGPHGSTSPRPGRSPSFAGQPSPPSEGRTI